MNRMTSTTIYGIEENKCESLKDLLRDAGIKWTAYLDKHTGMFDLEIYSNNVSFTRMKSITYVELDECEFVMFNKEYSQIAFI